MKPTGDYILVISDAGGQRRRWTETRAAPLSIRPHPVHPASYTPIDERTSAIPVQKILVLVTVILWTMPEGADEPTSTSIPICCPSRSPIVAGLAAACQKYETKTKKSRTREGGMSDIAVPQACLSSATTVVPKSLQSPATDKYRANRCKMLEGHGDEKGRASVADWHQTCSSVQLPS